jgi:hypothetical protein
MNYYWNQNTMNPYSIPDGEIITPPIQALPKNISPLSHDKQKFYSTNISHRDVLKLN